MSFVVDCTVCCGSMFHWITVFTIYTCTKMYVQCILKMLVLVGIEMVQRRWSILCTTTLIHVVSMISWRRLKSWQIMFYKINHCHFIKQLVSKTSLAVLKLWSRQCLVRSRFNVCLKLLDFVSRIHTYLLTCYLLAVCETKCCGIIDQSLFYIDLTVHYIVVSMISWRRLKSWQIMFYKINHCHFIKQLVSKTSFEFTILLTQASLRYIVHTFLYMYKW
jgi:predicted RNase H-related nuclease YkuK (DUF458 family)